MKPITLILALAAAACSQPAPAPVPGEALPPRLNGALMPAYMKALPEVLKASELFIASPEGKASAKDPDNFAFYAHLYGDSKIAPLLREAGFADASAFGEHHDAVVALFLSISQNPDLVQEAKTGLPALQKELEPLLLKQSRDKNNVSLNRLVARLETQTIVYQNILILEPHMKRLQDLNGQ